MSRGTFIGDDIDIYFTQQEACTVDMLEIKNRKIQYKPVEIPLKTQDGTKMKAVIQRQQFEHLGDGIEVQRKDYGFFIRLNEKACWGIVDNDLYGTRYDGSNKINFRRVSK
ncbi:MAG: hypothetical protein JW716_04015 [Candidatus Aenigmarchaeota archaeon]|nr:hypothetical protein [Candidatus Aenigmarchaeota archaeon]